MIFRELEIGGVFLLEPEIGADRRGFFTRGYCRRALEERGLDPAIVRCEVAVEHRRGVVRGLDCQESPYEEARLLRCTRGRVHAVALDLRPGSPTRGRHVGLELSAEERSSLYLPEGVARGFQTLEEETEVLEQLSELYHAEYARRLPWDDPTLGIDWPLPVPELPDPVFESTGSGG